MKKNPETSSLIPPDLGPLNFLLDTHDDIRFVVKDLEHKYIYINNTWMDNFGYNDASKILGKTAWDLFPKWRAKRYIEEEKNVMTSQLTQDYEEFQLNTEGIPERWRTIKAPWVKNGKAVGFINIGIKLKAPDQLEKRTDILPPIVQAIAKHACTDVSLDNMSADLGFSRRTMDRRFKELMRESPQKFRMRCRIATAKAHLRKGVKVADTAHLCGFNDQSHFSKAFKSHEGISPKKFQQIEETKSPISQKNTT